MNDKRIFELGWVKGHSGHRWNNRADELANVGRQSSTSSSLDVDAGAAAELVFATVGARPDLGDILRRANEELGADADVLIGGPQRLVDGLEDRLKGRVVERMTWAM